MLNRIMLISAVVVSFISAASTLFGAWAIIIAAAICAAGFVICILLKKHAPARSFALVFPVALLFCLPCYMAQSKAEAAEDAVGQTAYISGYVCEEPEYKNGYTVYTIKTDSIDISGAPQNLKIKITDFNAHNLDIFDNISAKVTFGAQADEFRFSNLSDGIYISAQCSEILPLGTVKSSIYSTAVNIRRSIRSAIYNYLPYEEASVICGIMLGDRDNIPATLYAAFKSCGIIHIVSVSGLHLSVICYSLLKLLRALKLPRKIPYILTALSVVVIMAVTGFSPSILRAGFMFLLVLLGRCIFRATDTLNLLGCSVVINSFINPFVIFDVGFQLSVLSTMGIVITVPFIEKTLRSRIKNTNFLGRALRGVIIGITQCLAATLFSLPAICNSIGYISLTAPVAAVLLILPATITLITAVPAAVLALGFLNFLSYPLFLVAGLLTKYLNFIVRLLDSISFSTVRLEGSEAMFCILLCYALCAVAFTVYPNRRAVKLTCVGTAFILSLNILITSAISYNLVKVDVVSLSSGHSAVVLTANNSGTVVICAEMSPSEFRHLGSEIESANQTIDLLVVPATGTDMRQEVSLFLTAYNIKCILIADEELLSACSNLGNGTIVGALGAEEIDLWGKAVLTQYADNNGTALTFSSQAASFAVTYPLNGDFVIPEALAAADIAFLSAPYPQTLPDYIHHTGSVLTAGGEVSENIYDFYSQSRRVTTMNPGDVISFSLNKKPIFY